MHGQFEIKHGGSHSPLYNVWAGMKKRCSNPNHPHYGLYGGRGIKVCALWEKSFDAFRDYIGPRPSKRHSIDRFPNPDGNYEPGNVRWATPEQQNRNRGKFNKIVEFRGEKKSIGEWIELLGLKRDRTYWRLDRGGWTVEAAFTVEDGNQNRPVRPMHSEAVRVNHSVAQRLRWARVRSDAAHVECK